MAVREYLNGLKISDLRRMANEYGINNSDEETKESLIDQMTNGVVSWAKKQDLAEVTESI